MDAKEARKITDKTLDKSICFIFSRIENEAKKGNSTAVFDIDDIYDKIDYLEDLGYDVDVNKFSQLVKIFW